MEFITLPPEVTSALIHAGPGPQSLIEASNAWQQLSADLEETSQSYVTMLSELTQGWGGPSEAAMSTAVGPYLTWLRNTAQQCQQLGNSALAATVAFNSAVTTVVPVATVTANRIQLAQLLATNGFGKNLAAIAATEAQYQEMWVNNASALYRYEASSAQATTLSLFSTPPTIVNPAAAAQATTAANSAATDPLSTLTSIVQSLQSFPDDQLVTNPWFQLANTYANQYFSSGFPINLLSYLAQNTSAQALQAVAPEIGQGLTEGEDALGSMGASIGASLSSAVKSIGAAVGAAPTALVGAAIPMGNLSVPPVAAGLMPAAATPVQLASVASPLTDGDTGLGGMLPPLMPPPMSAGSGWRKRKDAKYEDLAMGLEVKGTVMRRNPSAG